MDEFCPKSMTHRRDMDSETLVLPRRYSQGTFVLFFAITGTACTYGLGLANGFLGVNCLWVVLPMLPLLMAVALDSAIIAMGLRPYETTKKGTIKTETWQTAFCMNIVIFLIEWVVVYNWLSRSEIDSSLIWWLVMGGVAVGLPLVLTGLGVLVSTGRGKVEVDGSWIRVSGGGRWDIGAIRDIGTDEKRRLKRGAVTFDGKRVRGLEGLTPVECAWIVQWLHGILQVRRKSLGVGPAEAVHRPPEALSALRGVGDDDVSE